MTVAITLGNKVSELFSSPDFCTEYERLYQSCPWATPFQHYHFVRSWYDAYQEHFAPVLSTWYSNGRLKGVLALAQDRAGRLVAAGNEQAEYQCWLALPATSDRFIHMTIISLWTLYPGENLVFRYLPSGVPWVRFDQEGMKGCWRLRTVERPAVSLRGDTRKSTRGKGKKKVNDPEEPSDLVFKKIENRSEFLERIETILLYRNLREGALGGVEDPNAMAFYKSLFDKRLLRLTTLETEGRMLAAHVGLAHKEKAYSLRAVRTFHGPAAQFPGLSLDPVKKKWSREPSVFNLLLNQAQQREFVVPVHLVGEMMVFANYSSFWATWVRRGLTKVFARVAHRLRPPLMRRGFDRLRQGYRALGRRLPRALRRIPIIYRADKGLFGTLSSGRVCVSQNRVDDLLLYRPTKGKEMSRPAFLRAALERLGNGFTLFTHVDDGRLVASAWVAFRKEALPSELSLEVDVYSSGPLIFGVQLSAPGPQVGECFLEAVCRELASSGEGCHLWLLPQGAGKLLVHAAEVLGFSPVPGTGELDPLPENEGQKDGGVSAGLGRGEQLERPAQG